MSWSPEQYVIFEDERTRPVRDLLNAISSADPHSAVDLGCGPGNSTEVLAARFPNATVTGLDSSADMIAKARKRLPALRFDVAAIETWNDAGPFDVILANAVLQWVPNHDILLPRLVSKLTPRGSLAAQMPDNLDEPAHQLMREVAVQGPWAAKLANAAASRTPSKNAGWYYSLLKPYCARVDVWRTVYHHPLAGGADAIVEWFKGSGLLPFLTPLEEDERSAYLDRYRASVARAYPAQPDGTVLLPFPRLFIAATR
jgi:trans-aconitate 2-methyltransferase